MMRNQGDPERFSPPEHGSELPEGLKDPSRVRRMFGAIAPTYDFLNHFLSANRDRAWRRQAIRFAGIRPGDRVLDVCTGTGDLVFEAARCVWPDSGGRVLGTDFCPEMVRIAKEKQERLLGRRRTAFLKRIPGAGATRFAVADTLRLPFQDCSFDVVTVAFGIRNVANLIGGLNEMRRVLRHGGRAAILEFTTPPAAWFRRLFGLYFHHVVPLLGKWLSAAPASRGDDAFNNAYRYLPESVDQFPGPEGLRSCLKRSGFSDVRYRLLTFGIAAIHVGTKRQRG